MNKQQVELAVNAGLELLGPESDVAVPVKLNEGIFFLRAMLTGIATGNIGLAPTTQPVDPGAEPPPGAQTPNRKTRRKAAAKKRSKKKVSRKKK